MRKLREGINFSKYLLKYGINIIRYPFMSDSAIFADIYKKKIWHNYGSVSGDGSTSEMTNVLVEKLSILLKKYKIKSILDIPCGDFSWMNNVEMDGIKYIGADIVPELIENNSVKFANRKNCEFRTIDLCSDSLPEVDMIFCRDCLVHLSNKNIFRALENIQKSRAKYIMLTTFPDHNSNFNMLTGAWRPINFEKKPFNLPAPLEILNENFTLRNARFTDKSMGLWRNSNNKNASK
jgi:SAM-dependent methyltransferase